MKPGFDFNSIGHRIYSDVLYPVCIIRSDGLSLSFERQKALYNLFLIEWGYR